MVVEGELNRRVLASIPTALKCAVMVRFLLSTTITLKQRLTRLLTSDGAMRLSLAGECRTRQCSTVPCRQEVN